MRRTAGKTSSEPIVLGDLKLAEVFAQALMASVEVKRWTHGFHTWPAGLHPDAAAMLVAALPGDSLLDPFCGGGTTLVEAMADGRRAVGFDLSPVAVRVARTRTTLLQPDRISRMRSRARKFTEVAREASARPDPQRTRLLEEWYAPHALCELESIRHAIESVEEDVRTALEGAFSSILVKTSWRRSDTSAQRVKHDRQPGTAAILFHKKVRELGRRFEALRQAVPDGTALADVQQGDAREVRLEQPVDLVLTSPPYPSTYDYLPQQQLRHGWFDEWPEANSEIGPRRAWRSGARQARQAWLADTHAWQKAAADALKPGGHLVVVIGDGLAPSGIIDTSRPTEDAAQAAGLVNVARASVERTDHARDTIRWEHILAYRKPV
jgi:DNA modification methylase